MLLSWLWKDSHLVGPFLVVSSSYSGKTSSTIIENIKAIAKPEIGFAFFYLDINDKDKRTSRSLLSSLSLSLTAKLKNYSPMQMLYEKHDKLHFPTEDELLDLLMKLIQSFKQTYIVIDALDECECDDYNQLFHVIKTIHSRQLSHLHLVVSSRREQDILEQMKECTAEICLSAELVESDIISYVDATVAKEHKFQKWSPSVQAWIKEALINGANGMFRWVACIIEVLKHCPSERVLMESLKCLPADLEVIYDKIFEKIHRPLMPYAKVVLTWLIFGMRPLALRELAIVVTFDPSNGTFDTSLGLPHPDDVIKVCSSLVMKTEHGTVQLAHSSVQEYFLGKQSALCDPGTLGGHDLIAHCCLRYLMQIGPWHTFPLLRYSANFWVNHYRLSCKDSTLIGIVVTLFEDSICFSRWVQSVGISYSNLTSLLSHEPSIAYAGFLGLEDIVKGLVMKNGWSNEYSNTIEFAAMNGYINIVKFILGMGADVNAKNALRHACSRGHTEIVKLLLDRGEDVNVHQALDGLYFACKHGHTEIVQLLLDKGAGVNAHQAFNGLNSACQHGHTEIVKLILDKGVDVDTMQTLDGLNSACQHGHTEIVKLLVGKGADVNAQKALNGLDSACQHGYTKIAKLLLDKGADVNAHQALDGLYSACQHGHTEIVKLILDKGVDVDTMQTLDGLNSACQHGHTEIVKVLLDKGADVNAQKALCGLDSACQHGYTEIVKLLLDKGAGVNAHQALNGLYAACKYGHTEIVKVLLDKGADVNAHQALNGLASACQHGHTEIVKLFLDSGVDVKAEEVSNEGHTEIVKLLLDKGSLADINAQQCLDGFSGAHFNGPSLGWPQHEEKKRLKEY